MVNLKLMTATTCCDIMIDKLLKLYFFFQKFSFSLFFFSFFFNLQKKKSPIYSVFAFFFYISPFQYFCKQKKNLIKRLGTAIAF